MELKL
jgi:hypothetical protein